MRPSETNAWEDKPGDEFIKNEGSCSILLHKMFVLSPYSTVGINENTVRDHNIIAYTEIGAVIVSPSPSWRQI